MMPRPGWGEHDPAEIWERTRTVIEITLPEAGLRVTDLSALGLTKAVQRALDWVEADL